MVLKKNLSARLFTLGKTILSALFVIKTNVEFEYFHGPLRTLNYDVSGYLHP